MKALAMLALDTASLTVDIARASALAQKGAVGIWGTPNCGKGQPSQIARTGHGAAPARFRNVQVGVMKPRA